jgi:type IV pilus assembly protein PilE
MKRAVFKIFKERSGAMKRGFTMTEVLITVVIIAVLAAIAFPGFSKTQQKNDASQAITYLRAIRLAEKMYYAKNGTYLACANAAAIRSSLGTEVTTEKYTYVVTAPTAGVPPVATTFTATATRTSDAKTITLNQNGAWGGSYTPLPEA